MKRSDLALLLGALMVYALLLGCTSWGYSGYPGGGDASYYRETALALSRYGRYAIAPFTAADATLWRPPGYSLWVAGWLALFGDHPLAVRLPQLALHGAATYLAYLLAFRLTTSHRAARVSAATYFLALPSLWAVRLIMSEALSIPLTLALLTATVYLPPDRWGWRDVGVGGLLGYLALVRPQMLLLLPIVTGWQMWIAPTWRQRGLRIGLFLLTTGCVLAPWLLYTAQLTGHPTLGLSGCARWITAEHYAGRISYRWGPHDWAQVTDAWQVHLQEGARRASPHSPLPRNVQSELYTDRVWAEQARATMQKVPPAAILRDLPRSAYYLWAPGLTGSLLFVWLLRVQWLLYGGLTVIGICSAHSRWRLAGLLLLPCLLLTAAHLLLVVEPRYSFPLRPFLLVYAGLGATVVMGRMKGAGGAGAIRCGTNGSSWRPT